MGREQYPSRPSYARWENLTLLFVNSSMQRDRPPSKTRVRMERGRRETGRAAFGLWTKTELEVQQRATG